MGLFGGGGSDISCRTGSKNITAVSGLSADTNLLAKSVPGPVQCCPNLLHQLWGQLYISHSDGFSISCRDSTFGRNSTSGIAAELRPPRTCDPRTTVEVISVRLTSPERITTTGVGASSRAAGTETDSLSRLLRPTLLVRTVSVVSSELFNQNGVTEST